MKLDKVSECAHALDPAFGDWQERLQLRRGRRAFEKETGLPPRFVKVGVSPNAIPDFRPFRQCQFGKTIAVPEELALLRDAKPQTSHVGAKVMLNELQLLRVTTAGCCLQPILYLFQSLRHGRFDCG